MSSACRHSSSSASSSEAFRQGRLATAGDAETDRIMLSDPRPAAAACGRCTTAVAGSRSSRWCFRRLWFECAGHFQQQPITPARWLRLLVSVVGTVLLLAGSMVVLLLCLNLQGYIPPHFQLLHVGWLARLSLPGAPLGPDQALLLSKVMN
jgi:hypothetical protein